MTHLVVKVIAAISLICGVFMAFYYDKLELIIFGVISFVLIWAYSIIVQAAEIYVCNKNTPDQGCSDDSE